MLVEVLKEKNLKSYLSYFNKKRKRFRNERLIYGIVLFLLTSMLIVAANNHLLFLLTPITFYIGYKVPYVNLMIRKKEADLTVSFLFPQFLQSFIALSSSSRNVYQMLKNSIPYTGEPLKSELVKLVKKIEKGTNKREDYMEFAEFIGTSEAYMIMGMIYQFSEFGVKKSTLNILEDYIQNISENKTNELISRKMSSMEKYGLIPLFITLFFVLAFSGVIFWHYFQNVIGTVVEIF